MKMLRFPRFDVAIVGARLDSVILARQLGEAGARVVLTDTGSSPPSDYVQALRFTASPDTVTALPAPLRVVFAEAGYPGSLDLMRLSGGVEDFLLDVGVTFLYEVMPAGLLTNEETCAGLILGGTCGLAALPATVVVDATSSGTLIATMHGTEVGPPSEWSLAGVLAPAENARRSAESRDKGRGGHSMGGAHVEITIQANICPPELRFSRRGRRSFAAEKLGELVGTRQGRRLERVAAFPLERFANSQPVDSTRGLVRIRSTDDVLERIVTYLSAPVVMKAERASVIWIEPAAAESRAARVAPTFAEPQNVQPSWELRVYDSQYAEPRVSVLEVSAPPLPDAGQVELLVAGGGACGVPAAVEAARSGISTFLAERHMDLGGANTVGGVTKNWFGRWTPYFSGHYRRVRAAALQSRLPMPFVLLDLCRAQGVKVHTGALCVGVFVERRKVRSEVAGVVLLDEEGIRMIRPDFVIDATGDGHLAAMSGAPYRYGAERDEMTYWASFGSFHHGNTEASRQYHSVVDSRSAWDVTRGIIAGRRLPGIFGTGELPAAGMVFRESRHIEGISRLTYLDVLLNRARSDGVLVCHSNLDIKGIASSEAALLGFVEPDFLGEYDATLPLGAITTPAMANLVIGGRAHAASHDAFSMARMQPDMASLGVVAARLVSALLRSGGDGVTIRSLQHELVTAGVITNEDVKRFAAAGECDALRQDDSQLSPDELDLLVDRLVMGPLSLRRQARILAAGDRAVPYLEAALDGATGRVKSVVARMLAHAGKPSAVDPLLARLRELTDNGRTLPLPAGSHHQIPDHGWMPEAAYVIYALGLVRAVESLPLLESITSRLVFPENTVDHHFSYAYVISETAGRIARHDCLSMLRRITANERLQRAVAAGLPTDSDNYDPRKLADPVDERYAYLLFCAVRAQARCGDEEGALAVAGFLSDSRLFLARSAKAALEKIVGADHGFERAAWEAEIRAKPPATVPLCVRFD